MYIETILTRESKTIDLGKPVTVSRATAGLHLVLSHLVTHILDALSDRDATQCAALLFEYVGKATGLSIDTLRQCVPATKIITGFIALERFNRLRTANIASLKEAIALAQANQQPPQPDGTKAFNYDGREYAVWVHKLASRYGWTRHYIYNELMPEEVLLYLQEIAISEADELDLQRAQSELFYKVDKTPPYRMTYIPIERPAWMVPGGLDAPKTLRIEAGAAQEMLPAGVILDYSSFAGFEESITQEPQ